MEKKILFTGMLVLALAFGLTVVGCDNDTTKDLDTALNGTWVSVEGITLKFNNGSFEYEFIGEGGGYELKGPYSTNNGTLTMTPTHMRTSMDGLDPAKWYTRNELIAIFGEEATEGIDMYFVGQPISYSISGNNLTTETGEPGETLTLTKQ